MLVTDLVLGQGMYSTVINVNLNGILSFPIMLWVKYICAEFVAFQNICQPIDCLQLMLISHCLNYIQKSKEVIWSQLALSK